MAHLLSGLTPRNIQLLMDGMNFIGNGLLMGSSRLSLS